MLLSQAGIDGGAEGECVAEMGGRAVHDEPHTITEVAIRGFYQHYRRVMDL
jgi:salicylate 5-hydroxylase large subunit